MMFKGESDWGLSVSEYFDTLSLGQTLCCKETTATGAAPARCPDA